MSKIVKYAFAAIGILLLLAIFGLFVRAVFFPVNVAGKVMDTTAGVVDKTLNADNVLFNYEMFHDLYNGTLQLKANIEQVDKQIADLKAEYSKPTSQWDKEGRKRLSFLEDTRNGYLMQYNRNAADYNSNASKLNRKLFKDRSLPYQIELLN